MDLNRAVRRAPWIAAAAVFVTGVAGGVGIGWSAKVVSAAQNAPLAADADARTASDRLGRCLSPAEPALVATEHLPRVDRWLEVTDLGPGAERAADPGTYAEAALLVRDMARPSQPAAAKSVRLPGGQLEAVEWAVRSRSRAFLALQAEKVSYVLVRHAAGPHFFAGPCATATLTDPLRRMLPTRYDAAMAGLVGLRAHEVLPALLRAQRDEVTAARPGPGRG